MTRPAAGQIWDADRYRRDAGFVADLGQGALDLLAPAPGEAILDLGCGDGRLTVRIAAAGAAVTGLEPDPSLAAAARSLGLEVIGADAHAPFGTGAYDAVFSNAALHWMKAPETVFANVHAALKPGGRFVAEQGGFGNCATIVTAVRAALEARGIAPDFAWDFPSPTKQARRLRQAGFAVEEIARVPRPTPLPAGMSGWLDVFVGPYIAGLAAGDADAVRADTLRRLEPVLFDADEGWSADYVRLRFRARKGPRAR